MRLRFATTLVTVVMLAFTMFGCTKKPESTPKPGGSNAANTAAPAGGTTMTADQAAKDSTTPTGATTDAASATGKVPALLDFTMDSIQGKPVNLADYKGKVLLIVNVASKCGHTPQYAKLEKLYQDYGKDGLVVIGFPCNQFGNQEPGTNAQILQFCSATYHVKFPMMSKIEVNGAGRCPLYAKLTSKEYCPQDPGDVKWNFEKFLIGRDGQLIARFRSGVEPDDPKVVAAIDSALKGS